MPIAMVRCTICGAEVTKKSTFSLKEIGGNEGRACRTHPEVQELVRQHTQHVAEERTMRKAEEAMQTLSGVAAVRVFHSFHGMPTEVVYGRLRAGGYSNAAIKRIEEEVAREGGPQMSNDEMLGTVLTATELGRRS